MDIQKSEQLNAFYDRGMISPRAVRSLRNDWNKDIIGFNPPSAAMDNQVRSLRRRRSDLSGGDISRQSSFNDSTDYYGDSFPDLLSSLSQMSVDNHAQCGFSSKDFTCKGMTHVDDEIDDNDVDGVVENEDSDEDMLEKQEEEIRMRVLLTSSSGPDSSSDERASNLERTSFSLLSPTQANGSFYDEISPGVVVDSLKCDHQKAKHNPSKRVRVRLRVRSKGSMGGIL